MDDASTQESLELDVTNFGPIIKATVDLRPLTVFVGPSNTGKSYLAILIYALHRHFSGEGVEPGPRPLPQGPWVLPGRWPPETDIEESQRYPDTIGETDRYYEQEKVSA